MISPFFVLYLSRDLLGINRAALGDGSALDMNCAPFVLKREHFGRGKNGRELAEEAIPEVI